MVAQPMRPETSTLRRAPVSGPLIVTVIMGRSAAAGAFLRGGAVMAKRASNCQSAKASDIDPEMSVFCADDADTFGNWARPSAMTIGAVAKGIFNFPASSKPLAILVTRGELLARERSA